MVKNPPSESANQRFILPLISLFLIALGLGAILYLGYSIATNEDIEAARNSGSTPAVTEEAEDAPAGEAALEQTSDSVVLAFLDNYGITVPLLTLVIGGLLTMLGVRVLQHHISAGRWAQVAFVWLTVGAVLVGIVVFFNNAERLNEDRETVFDLGNGLEAAAPFLIIAIPLGAAFWWVSKQLENYAVFTGEENIAASEARVAWNLLIPTMAILVLVAARPLEETFITSLTDKSFAEGADRQIEFVGLDNYASLFNINPVTVDCRPDRENPDECAVRPNGSIAWEAREVGDLQVRPETRVVELPFSDQGLALVAEHDKFVRAIENTLQFTFVSVLLELILGLSIALMVNANFPGQGIMRTVMLIPWAIPTVVSAKLWSTMYLDTSSGVINRIGMDLGLMDRPINWLTNPDYQMFTLILVDVWKTTPFMALLLLAGLQTLPKDIYESASVDGASRFTQFVRITLPLLRPTIAVALVFRTLDALRVFDLFHVLIRGADVPSLATFNHEILMTVRNQGLASAIGVVMFVMILIFTVLYVRILQVEAE